MSIKKKKKGEGELAVSCGGDLAAISLSLEKGVNRAAGISLIIFSWGRRGGGGGEKRADFIIERKGVLHHFTTSGGRDF